jgi:outer membrane lipoprotein-sorting protein
MKGLFIIALFIFGLTATGYSQYLTAKDSDPEAVALLTKASKGFSGTNNVQVNFRVRTSIPGQVPVTNDGLLYQGGTSYRVELKDYNIISNGTTRWVYLKGPNEVNIYNESNGQDWISPQDFLRLHTSPDLVFTLKSSKDGISIIEAKPLKGRFDEYSKFVIGITHDKLSYINALSSDGSRQEMSINSVTTPATWDAAKLFTFNKDAYPGVYVEDLRLD